MSFYTDVIKPSGEFGSVKRVAAISLLEPITRDAVTAIIADASSMGIGLMVYETYRSAPRQHALFVNGASKLSKVGVHHYGLACDLVRVIHGEPSWKGDFSFLGKLAAAHGLVWGGDWPHFPDLVHVQRLKVADQGRLFDGSWYPDAGYVAR